MVQEQIDDINVDVGEQNGRSKPRSVRMLQDREKCDRISHKYENMLVKIYKHIVVNSFAHDLKRIE